jgi:hypothetical protein
VNLRARVQGSNIVCPFNTLLLSSFSLTSRLFGEVYYLLYSDNYEMPSKVAIDPEEPSLGRIRADSVPPPHGAASIKRCISRVERTPELAHAELFADVSCKTPLKEEGHIPILRTDCPGLSPNKPMAIVQMPIEIPDGKYLIKNRTVDIFWGADNKPIGNVYFCPATMEQAKNTHCMQVNKHSLQLFKCSKDNSLFSGTSQMILLVTSS